MIVVADASPLNYLVIIGQDRLLPILFDRIVAPTAVIRELRHHRAPLEVNAWAESPPDWLEVMAPVHFDETLKLGQGELEAIGLAQELHADALLLDERRALAVALRLGLVVRRTIGILDAAAERKLVDLPAAIAELRKTTFRSSDRVYAELLERDAARRAAEL